MSTNEHPSPPGTFSVAEPSASDSNSGQGAGRRLEDRIAEFLQGLEQPAAAENYTPSHLPPTRSVAEGTDGGRLSSSTSCPVHIPQPVGALPENETDYGAQRPSSAESPPAQPHRSREKRTRPAETMPPQLEVPSSISTRPSMETGGEYIGRPAVRPLSASHPNAARALHYYNPTILQPSHTGPTIAEGIQATHHGGVPIVSSHVRMDVPTVGQLPVREVESVAMASSGGGKTSAAALDFLRNTFDLTADVPRMTALEKAKVDWETHITAMERVLAANRAQGLPSQTVSIEALQLLSQMVGNLYSLNTQLLYAQIQHVLDAHQKNADRINDVFRGLAGKTKRQRKES